MLATARDAASAIVDATRPSQLGQALGPGCLGSGLNAGFKVPCPQNPVSSQVAVICYPSFAPVYDSTSTTTPHAMPCLKVTAYPISFTSTPLKWYGMLIRHVTRSLKQGLQGTVSVHPPSNGLSRSEPLWQGVQTQE